MSGPGAILCDSNEAPCVLLRSTVRFEVNDSKHLSYRGSKNKSETLHVIYMVGFLFLGVKLIASSQFHICRGHSVEKIPCLFDVHQPGVDVHQPGVQACSSVNTMVGLIMIAKMLRLNRNQP